MPLMLNLPSTQMVVPANISANVNAGKQQVTEYEYDEEEVSYYEETEAKPSKHAAK